MLGALDAFIERRLGGYFACAAAPTLTTAEAESDTGHLMCYRIALLIATSVNVTAAVAAFSVKDAE